jgi:hypothetical protein
MQDSGYKAAKMPQRAKSKILRSLGKKDQKRGGQGNE